MAVNSPKTKTHLAVFLEVKHFPQASIKVTVSIPCTSDCGIIVACSALLDHLRKFGFDVKLVGKFIYS